MSRFLIFCTLTIWSAIFLCVGCDADAELVAVSSLIGNELELVESSENTYSVPLNPNQLLVIKSDDVIAAITIDSYSNLRANFRIKYYNLKSSELIEESGELHEEYFNYVRNDGILVKNLVSGSNLIAFGDSEIEWSAGPGTVSYFYFDKTSKVYVEKSHKKGITLFDRIYIGSGPEAVSLPTGS